MESEAFKKSLNKAKGFNGQATMDCFQNEVKNHVKYGIELILSFKDKISKGKGIEIPSFISISTSGTLQNSSSSTAPKL